MERTMSFTVWAVINLIAFIAVIVVNGMANIIPLNGIGTGELSDLYPNLFVPAGITFSIWGIIYLLLAGFTIFSLKSAAGNNPDPVFIGRIGPWFMISCAANVGWIFAWHWKKTGLSLGIMLVILISLIIIYLKTRSVSDTRGIFAFLKLPFSVYLGWITVATIANITAVLVHNGWKGFGISEQAWSIIVISCAVVITCIINYRRKDIGYTLVILWALLGIFLKRSDMADAPQVTTGAAVGMAVTAAFYAVKVIFLK